MTAQPTFFLGCDAEFCIAEYHDQGYAAPLDEVRVMAARHGWTVVNKHDLCPRCSERAAMARADHAADEPKS